VQTAEGGKGRRKNEKKKEDILKSRVKNPFS
jgi:hypothetical protein